MKEQIEAIKKQMQEAGISDSVIQEFLRRVQEAKKGSKGNLSNVSWDDVGDLEEQDIVPLEKIKRQSHFSVSEHSSTQSSKAFLASLAVIKLNGGLGTSMGLTKAKSLIPIRDGKNFLDIICLQTLAFRKKYSVSLPVFFMNSFATQEDTVKVESLARMNAEIEESLGSVFLQNQVPRLYQNNFFPLEVENFSQEAWCPPGHGDVFFALKNTGLLNKLLRLGYETVFISNSDNLGAVVEPSILEYMQKEKLDWISEVTQKTLADKKGGVLFRRKNQKQKKAIDLLEIAQVPKENQKDFQDLSRFSFFNVNNLWVNLKALDNKLERNSLHLALIQNQKTIQTRKVLQLETAMGSGISCFEKSRIILVPRIRFSPVKTCADLLIRRSDACYLDPKTYSFFPVDEKIVPSINLSSNYSTLPSFDKLFSIIPSVKRLVSLDIEGALYFDIPVILEGRVHFRVETKNIFPISRLCRKRFSDERVNIPN